MKPRLSAKTIARMGRRAFTLIEVMVALALFFMCTFAILGLTSRS